MKGRAYVGKAGGEKQKSKNAKEQSYIAYTKARLVSRTFS